MGKATGFLEYARKQEPAEAPLKRIEHFNEFHTPLSRSEQEKQGARCMNCGVPFCQAGQIMDGMMSGCPLQNMIPEWNHLLYLGNWEEAYYRLAKTSNFPEFTGRVCPGLCDLACTCNLDGDPVGGKSNELAIIENAYAKGYVKPKVPKVRTGKTVAVIGSGPSGLAVADQLNHRGHLVTVFERSDRVGGLLRYGIPNMKLEKQIIDRRVAIMEAEGVIFKTGCNVGVDITAEEIEKQFDRVVLCCGASNPRDIKAPGREAEGIYFAVDFLTRTTKSLLDSNLTDGRFIDCRDKHVLVIGGGDTGNDCCGTAIRLGCQSLTQLEMMPKAPDTRAPGNPWPVWPRVCKTDYGQEEAIALFGHDPRIYQTTVKEFISDESGKLKEAVIICLESKKDEATGRMMMVPIEGSEFTIPVDICLIAAGFLGSQDYVTEAFGVETDARTNVASEAGKHAASKARIFTAGDMHMGQSLVVRAIRDGRDAAKEVDESLMGYSNM